MKSLLQLNESELQKLQRRFDALVSRTGQKVAKQAVRAATQPVLDDMRANVPVRSGTTRKAIKKSVRGFRKTGYVVGLVGVARGVSGNFQGRRVVPEYYAHLIEYGRQSVQAPKGKLLSNQNGFAARSARAAAARPFIRPAFRRQRKRMETIARQRLSDGIDKVAKEVAAL